MGLRKGYKQTEVGVIPEDWEIYNINDLTSVLGDGIHSTPLYSTNGDYFFINGNNLSDGSVVITETTKRVTHKEYLKHKNNLNDRTIFISINGTIGSLAYYNNEPVMLGKSAAYLNVKNGFSKVYFYYALQAEIVLQFFEDGLTGTTIKNLGLGTIRNTPILLPPTKTEQTAIANALSDADAWIQSLTRLIAKKRQIKQGAMQTLLNPYENGRLKAGWVEKKLGDVADVIGGGTPSSFNSSFWNGDIDWYTPTEIGGNKYVYESRRKITKEGYLNSSANLLPIGAVLLTSRAGIGDLGILMNEGCTNQGFQSLISKECMNYEFLYYLMGTLKNILLQNASGSTFLEISPGKLKKIEVVVPQKTEQTHIATILSDMDNEITALESKLTKAQQIKQGMMQNLLTGRIRLIGTGASAPDSTDKNRTRLKPHVQRE